MKKNLPEQKQDIAGLNGERMTIILPDKSVVALDKATLRFYSIEPATPQEIHDRRSALELPKSSETINFGMLASFLEKPHRRFTDCFRRTSDAPHYRPKQAADFHLLSITNIYEFPGSYQGGTFCSSQQEWRFLDGGLICHNGYGWGSSSWTAVWGAEALRAICMFYGIHQPRMIKGETSCRALSHLLEDMTSIPKLEDQSGQLFPVPSVAAE